MQETHSLKICENTWTDQFGCGNNHIVFSHATSDSRRVLIAFREASNFKVVNQVDLLYSKLSLKTALWFF